MRGRCSLTMMKGIAVQFRAHFFAVTLICMPVLVLAFVRVVPMGGLGRGSGSALGQEATGYDVCARGGTEGECFSEQKTYQGRYWAFPYYYENLCEYHHALSGLSGVRIAVRVLVRRLAWLRGGAGGERPRYGREFGERRHRGRGASGLCMLNA